MAAIGRLTQKKFEQSILHGVTLVDFDAPWCKPCRDQKPIIDALKKNYQGTAAVKKIDIDDNRDIACIWASRASPPSSSIKDGIEMNRFIGLQTTETTQKHHALAAS
jgi:thioredoxin 1